MTRPAEAVRSWVARSREPLLGVAGLGVVGALVALACAVFLQAFDSGVRVTVHAPAAGLLLADGSDVRILGVSVGEVRGITVAPDGGALLRLSIRPDQASHVVLGTTATLSATTTFGPKYVTLLPGEGPRLSSGSTILATGTPTEINDVFAQLQDVLTTVQPAKLASTLGAFAQALDGRGNQLGAYAVQVRDYLTRLDPQLSTLHADLVELPGVTDAYAKAAPDLLATAAGATVTSATLSSQQAKLHAVLLDLVAVANRGSSFTQATGPALTAAVRQLDAPLSLISTFAPELACTIQGLSVGYVKGKPAQAGKYPAVTSFTGFLPADGKYTYPRDLPKLITGGGPSCDLLPEVMPNQVPVPHRNFADGSTIPAAPGDDGIQNVRGNLITVYQNFLGLGALSGGPGVLGQGTTNTLGSGR